METILEYTDFKKPNKKTNLFLYSVILNISYTLLLLLKYVTF